MRWPLAGERAAPTEQDAKVATALATAHHALSDAMEAQMADPDNNIDPDDEEVLSGIKKMLGAAADTMHAQAKDGSPDPVYQGDPDGTEGGGGGNAPVPDNDDGTGSRSQTRLGGAALTDRMTLPNHESISVGSQKHRELIRATVEGPHCNCPGRAAWVRDLKAQGLYRGSAV